MEFVSLYLELMADMRFAVLSSAFVLGLILFILLLGVLGKKEAPSVSFGSPPDATMVDVSDASPMMWGGESDKKRSSKPSAKPTSSTAAAPTSAPPPAHLAPAVDVHLHEALVRRIASLEADVKREPLYLDPIIKRLTALEKKAEEMLQKSADAGKAGGTLPDGFSQEYQALKGKVVELQRMLEHLSEGPTPPAP
jgi:hypothetical protein